MSRVALTVAIALGLLIVPGRHLAFADGVASSYCGGNFWRSSYCVTLWRKHLTDPHVLSVAEPQSEREIAEAREHERLWLARCRPKIWQDDFGVDRYVYAETGCEFGKFR